MFKKLNYILPLLLSLSVASCASSKKEPTLAPVSVKTELNRAKSDADNGNSKKALARLKRIIEKNPTSTAAHDAHILMGQIYYRGNDFANSYRAYLGVVNSDYASLRDAEARVGATRALQKLGRYDEAASLIQKVIKTQGLSTSLLLESHQLRYSILQQTGDRLGSLKSLVFLAENSANAQSREPYRLRSLEVVENRLSPEEVTAVTKDAEYGFVRPYAQLKVGKILFENKEYGSAEDQFNSVIALAPGSDLSAAAQKYLDQLLARRKVDPMVVGAILPLTGKQSAVAYKTLRGLQLGLGVAGRSTTNIKLAVIDSEGNPDAARRAVERLVVEDSAVGIVGDIVSRTAEVVAQKSEELGIPNISLSQRSGLTQVGPYIFRNALTSEAQVQELVRAAMDTQGLRRFAILYPNDAYGVEYANLFWDAVLARGGQIVAAQTYATDEKDFGPVIRRLVGTYYLEARAEEYAYLLRDWYSKQKSITSRTESPDDLLPPIQHFDAIFIPDSVRALGQIASMLIYQNVQSTRLLGTNLWNTKDLVDRGTKLIDNSIFVDASSSMDQTYQKSDFAKEYRATFGEEPTVFEAQAYDTGIALRRILTSGVSSRNELREKLESIGSFAGSVGNIRVAQREFSRPLTVLSVQAG
ncbi:MAG: penicillin-binding protein activator, partial [Bdellovibrionota bacterium]